MTDRPSLEKISICGFRGFSNFEINNLGAFNILVGSNDIGKTSLLEAIFLITGFSNLELPFVIQNQRGMIVDDAYNLRLLFHNLDYDTPITITAYSSGPVKSMKLTLSMDDVHSYIKDHNPKTHKLGEIDVDFHISRSRTPSSKTYNKNSKRISYCTTIDFLENDQQTYSGTIHLSNRGFKITKDFDDIVSKHILSSRYISPYLGIDADSLCNSLIHNKKNDLIRFMKNVNPKINDVSVKEDTVYVDIGSKNMIPLNLCGSGINRSSNILSLCISGDDQIILIDEIENGLHHSTMKPLLKFLLTLSREKNIQIIVTSQHIDTLKFLISVLNEENYSRYKNATNVYALQRNKDNIVRSYLYENNQLEHCISNGIEIR